MKLQGNEDNDTLPGGWRSMKSNRVVSHHDLGFVGAPVFSHIEPEVFGSWVGDEQVDHEVDNQQGEGKENSTRSLGSKIWQPFWTDNVDHPDGGRETWKDSSQCVAGSGNGQKDRASILGVKQLIQGMRGGEDHDEANQQQHGQEVLDHL